jgi:pimeloyl-ACP methyl ester carboxylesterase
MSTEQKLLNTLGVEANIKQAFINGFSVNYLEAGSGEPVILLHGGNIGWGQWYPNIKDFAKKYKIYALDLPGAGRSQKINFHSLDLERDLVKTVKEFIDFLSLTSFSLVGSSIGGWICLKLALGDQTKIKKLVVADSLGFMDFMRFSDRLISIKLFAKLLTKTVLKPHKNNPNIEKFLRDVFYDKKTYIKPEFIEYFYETMETSHNLLFISRMSSIKGVRKEFLLFNQLNRIKIPTLVIWGEQDKLMPLKKNESNFKFLPKIEVKIIKDAGHIPSVEKSEIFNHTVLEFLSK